MLPGNARDLEPSVKKSKKETPKTDKTPAKAPAKPVLKKVMDVKVPEDKSHPMIKWYFEQVLEKYIEYDLNLIAKKACLLVELVELVYNDQTNMIIYLLVPRIPFE